ncbi:MAG: hydantoinase B/oxoprolinase family protein [Desulfobulbaceae bacterium]
MPQTLPDPIYISVDRGGTFTDVYATCGDSVYTEKLLSSDPAYPDGPAEGIRRILERVTGTPVPPGTVPAHRIGWIRMGTTVATNALLERTGTDCALVVTRGFRDLLRIGYQNRPDLFALDIHRPEPLYRRVIEIDERVRPLLSEEDGRHHTVRTGLSGERYVLLRQPDPEVVRLQLEELFAAGIRSLAVVLMHGYSFTDHERLVGELARQTGFTQVSLSHEVMPRIRIVGRGDTTCVDAYLTPHIDDYLTTFTQGFECRLRDTPLFFMQSDGGLAEAGAFRGFNAILSGPAGGVVGCAITAYRELGGRPVIGFDMGGTSTDVSRYDGAFELIQENETAGVRIQAPQLDIRTVAAGGGSRLFYRNSVFTVGPESSGAHPGPVCYRKNGFLSVTDANLLLGRLQPDYFPRIFGPSEDQPLDRTAVEREFAALADRINADPANAGRPPLSPEEAALGFLDVANEVMVRPIREISIMRGFNIRDHVLACFGGAGGQHAVAVARALGIRTVFVHRHAGILSAIGIGAADVVIDRSEPAGSVPLEDSLEPLCDRLDRLADSVAGEFLAKGYDRENLHVTRYLNLRYEGTDTPFMIPRPPDNDFGAAFARLHRREFGFDLDRTLLVDDIRVRVTASLPQQDAGHRIPPGEGAPRETVRCRFREGWRATPLFLLEDLGAGQRITGPALIIQETSTILVEPDSTAEITDLGNVLIHLEERRSLTATTEADPVNLAIFSNRFMSIAEQMGRVLQKTALSTNIKERLDFSCALFDADGGLVANAPHVPVHLGAMSAAVRRQIELRGGDIEPGDVLLSNHPAAGGSHLPDLTVITPVWNNDVIRFFVASRGHHSDVGGIAPGSMPPFSRSLDDEGFHVKSFKIVTGVRFRERELKKLLLAGANPVRDPDTVIADLKAQIAANQRGIELLNGLMDEATEEVVLAYMGHIQANAEAAVRTMLRKLARDRAGGDTPAVFTAEDRLDDGSRIRLQITIDPDSGDACFDFTGTDPQLEGNLNAPPAVTQSAILYALRCLIAEDIPLNQGCLNPITIVLEPGSLLNPSDNGAVAGGNVLTSQRIVDVVLLAFQAAAASQGCMNNLTFGDETFGYYETIGGGSGAGPGWHGCPGVHTHMTNTRITDPEILEQRFPVLLRAFGFRDGSGGSGRYRGGDGLVREIEFLRPLHVSILSERRVYPPYGMAGGRPGARGRNLLLDNNGIETDLGGKNERDVSPGERIRILTPGGGGWGSEHG